MTDQTAEELLPELANYPGIITLPQVAKILRLSRTKAYGLAADGTLPALRIGGSVRVLKSDLAKLIVTQRGGKARRWRVQ